MRLSINQSFKMIIIDFYWISSGAQSAPSLSIAALVLILQRISNLPFLSEITKRLIAEGKPFNALHKIGQKVLGWDGLMLDICQKSVFLEI